MEVFRLSRRKYSEHLSGEGAASGGGRWNSVGTKLVYTSTNRSLAMAEVAVHLPFARVRNDFLMLTIFIPDDVAIMSVPLAELPAGWQVFPYSTVGQEVGDRFVMDGRYCALRVPSAVTAGDSNLLINPNHSDFARIKIMNIEEFTFDRRLVRG